MIPFWQFLFRLSIKPHRLFFLLLVFGISVALQAQEENARNKRPKITGQKALSINEGESITIQMTDITVHDRDDWFYPWGFTMTLYPGEDYSLSGMSVTPAAEFEGTLTVPVTVNDGEDDSEVYNLRITVNGTNDAPVITGQNSIVTNEDQPIKLQPSDVIITDPDDSQFSVNIDGGSHYTVSGETLTPEKDYNGELNVPITVNDGIVNSNQFIARIVVNPVNDAPRIIAQQGTLSTLSTDALTLKPEHLSVEDPDSRFPEDFSIIVLNGERYTVSGSDVLPNADFEGTLSVGVKVSDGHDESSSFPIQISVKKGKSAPVITNQVPVIINEDQRYTLGFADLIVVDKDTPYPQGFSMSISPGENYTVDGRTVTPKSDFNGSIFPMVTVSDGEKASDPFRFQITVLPINDAPVISTTDPDSVTVSPEQEAAALIENIEITDVDNETLAMAEVGFESGNYQPGVDRLVFTNTENIRGVFDEDAGVLALIGKASQKAYADALKSVQVIVAGDGLQENRIYLHVNDGQANSNQLRRKFTKTKNDTEMVFNIPTGFTPNDDQVNDTWSVTPLTNTENIQEAVIRIYNRSGMLLFESKDLAAAWDGKFNGNVLPPDVYFYTIDVKTDSPDQIPAVKGIVTILR